MKILPSDSRVLKYKQVEDEIRKLIRMSKMGAKLPPERELAESFDCNVLTVRKGIQPLVDEGLLHRRVGSGTFIAKLPSGAIHHDSPAAMEGLEHIAILIHNASDHYAYRVVRALAEAARDQGTELRSTWIQNFDAGTLDTVKGMVRAGCQALILPWFPAGLADQVRDFARQCPIPVVLPQIIPGLEHLCFEKPGVYGASTTLEVEGACEYFLQLGVSRIHFIGPDNPAAPVLQERITTYVCYASKRGFEPTFRLFDRSSGSVGALAKREKDFAGDLGILSYDDTHAVRFMTAMHQLGAVAPSDYRIIGHNDTSTAWHADPPLSTIRQNFGYVASAMVKSALALARGSVWQSDTSPHPQLVVRESCGGKALAGSMRIPKLDLIADAGSEEEMASTGRQTAKM